jgi:hypothetical protein
MDDDTMDFGQGYPGGKGRPPRWSARTKRIITTSAAGAVLLGSGIAGGIALTGGASASTSSPPVSTATSDPAATPSVTTSTSTGSSTGFGSSTGSSTGTGTGSSTGTGTAGSPCTKLVEELVLGNHLKLATRLQALCTHPLLRLALVGGEHGTVTFNSKSGPVTAVFERGTVESDSDSVLTVTALDGTTWSWDIVSNTEVRQDGQAATVGTGDQVFVVGTQSSGVNSARLVRITSTG